MNYRVTNNVQGYKECFGKNCKNHASQILKIKYINKTGYFCQRCSEDLIQSELAEEIISQGGGGV